MNERIIARNKQVVIGADVHQKKHVVTAMTPDGEYCHKAKHLSPNKGAWIAYLAKFPGCAVQVVYEAGPQGYNLHDWLVSIREKEGFDVIAVIAPPAMVAKAPGKKAIKTDKRDSAGLIKAWLKKDFVPVVVPDKAKRQERQVVRTRKFFKEQEVSLKNSVRSLLTFQGIPEPEGIVFSERWTQKARKAVEENDITGGRLLQVFEAILSAYLSVEESIKILKKEMKKIIENGECGEVARRLKELVGIGDIAAATIATEVADFRAFRNSEAFASYVGVVPGEYSSGERERKGHITRVGNSRLRSIFVECAWVWLQHDPEAKRIYSRIKAGKEKRKFIAIVALARKLAVKVYHKALNNPPPLGVAAT